MAMLGTIGFTMKDQMFLSREICQFDPFEPGKIVKSTPFFYDFFSRVEAGFGKIYPVSLYLCTIIVTI